MRALVLVAPVSVPALVSVLLNRPLQPIVVVLAGNTEVLIVFVARAVVPTAGAA